ncbi:hypothetical protein [Alloactinosynnema sp. L-07]|nr:hypothetical protein [Alloactinosynnema sp. L-07]
MVPTVEKPISLGDLWKRPCFLIPVWALEDFGIDQEIKGKPFQSGPGHGCAWSAPGQGDETTGFEVVAYPDFDILRDTYENASKRAVMFEPTGTRHFPAAYLVENDTSCTYVIAFSNTQGVKVTRTQQRPYTHEGPKERCEHPGQAAFEIESVIRHPGAYPTS